MLHDLNFLAEFTLDCWLLARAASNFESPRIDGQRWEQAIADLFQYTTLPNRQRAGLTTLFGVHSASGVPHELDAVASGSGRLIIIECKAQSNGVSKADAALFHEKTLDYYHADLDKYSIEDWWRVLASTTAVSKSVRTFCMKLGIILTDPKRVPLPVVLRTAFQPSADMFLREALLQDAVRLGERALMSLQDRWRYDARKVELRTKPNPLLSNEISDLLWLQEVLGSDILDLYQSYRPDSLKRRTDQISSSLRQS